MRVCVSGLLHTQFLGFYVHLLHEAQVTLALLVFKLYLGIHHHLFAGVSDTFSFEIYMCVGKCLPICISGQEESAAPNRKCQTSIITTGKHETIQQLPHIVHIPPSQICRSPSYVGLEQTDFQCVFEKQRLLFHQI